MNNFIYLKDFYNKYGFIPNIIYYNHDKKEISKVQEYTFNGADVIKFVTMDYKYELYLPYDAILDITSFLFTYENS